MSNLKIYKASAGSGKTYTLTNEYVKLLAQNSDNYKHTLAVTFTKMATAEMKDRILRLLHKESGSKNPLNAAKAQEQLNKILNDYSNFNISTIDSFFQSVLRSFALELNLDSTFKIELDPVNLIERAALELIHESNKSGEMTEWLSSFAEEKIESGKAWNLKNDLVKFGEQLGKEAFLKISSFDFERISDLQNIKAYKLSLQKMVDEFNKEVKEGAEKIINYLSSNGLDYPSNVDLYNGKSRSPISKLYPLERGDAFDLKLLEALEKPINEDKPFFKKDKQTEAYEDSLKRQIELFCISVRANFKQAASAQLVLKNLFLLGLISRLKLHFDAICREEELFPITNTQSFIHRIIDSHDTPFIYEKVGGFYNNFMIDEFQDTSQLQWSNFYPLVDNSLASNHLSMVVGDVKQAIYRFRNSDWNLLNSKVLIDFANQIETITLESNFRSDKNIIYFNNTIFPQFAQLVANTLTPPEEDIIDPQIITNIFKEAGQLVGQEDQKQEGYVEVRYLSKKELLITDEIASLDDELDADETFETEGDEEEKVNDILSKNGLIQTYLTIKKITTAIEHPFEYQDICILVRSSKEAEAVGNYLLDRQIPLLNSGTLTLQSSQALIWIIASVKHLIYTQNNLIQYEVEHHFTTITKGSADGLLAKIDALSQKPLFELIEGLIELLPSAVREEHGSYLRAFIDALTIYYNDYNPSIHEFLEWWSDKGYKKTISIPANMNAVKLMTVHSSKGLQFKVVIMPFASSVMNKTMGLQEIMWLTSEVEPFDKLPLLPVQYSSKMKDTVFAKPYYQETLSRLVDSLNVLYVALTRPEKALFIFTHDTDENKTPSSSLTFAKLFNSLKSPMEESVNDDDKPKTVELNSFYDEPSKAIIYGDIEALNRPNPNVKPEQPEEQPEEIKMSIYEAIPFEERLKVKLEQESYKSLTERDSKRKRGTQMHKVFEYIISHADVERAVAKTIREGIILESEKESLIEMINAKISAPHIYDWFSSENEIKTEATILSSYTYRPDRIVVTPSNSVIVVDYKFGDTKEKHYEKQVLEYMNVIKKMGYSDVRGKIWYVMLDEIVEV